MAEIDLLLLDRAVADGPSSRTRFGGAPSVAPGFGWPACRTCGGNMQFLGQVREDEAPRLHLVFVCQNDPGECDEWEADGGGNAVVCTGIDDLALAEPPAEGATMRAALYGARVERVRSARYDAARKDWADRHPGRRREVLGQIGGAVDWLLLDQTPTCDHCGRPMRFVAQLETGPDHETEMPFAGGCGYLFACACNGGCGKFLSQV